MKRIIKRGPGFVAISIEISATDAMKASGESPALSSMIRRCLSTLDTATRKRMERKFESCFVMAKQSIPFAKYPVLLELEQRHEVDIGHAYNTADCYSRALLLRASSRAS